MCEYAKNVRFLAYSDLRRFHPHLLPHHAAQVSRAALHARRGVPRGLEQIRLRLRGNLLHRAHLREA